MVHRDARSGRSVAVIGAGPAGLAAGRELLRQGFTQLTIFEALDGPGGTWRGHTYPGLSCDIWSHSYSFSYAPNPDWSGTFVPRTEILAYLERCCTDFGLDDHLVTDTRIVRAEWRSDRRWELTTDDDEVYEFDFVVNAMGNQHTPSYPDVPGVSALGDTVFAGDSFHGTRWDHSVPLEGRRVAVVGSAASAVQIVPEVAKVAGSLVVLQRSANWIMPRNRRAYTALEKTVFRRVPGAIDGLRKVQQKLLDQVAHAVTLGHPRMSQFEWAARRNLHSHVKDLRLREALTPDSRYGCKRGLVSDDFYPALTQPQVVLVPEGLASVTDRGVVTSRGREIDCDVLIFCTGYRILDFDRIDVVGAGGRRLADAMAGRPEVHKGIAMPGFPNYFTAVGANGLVLNVSYFKTAEQNVATIVRLMGELVAGGGNAMAVDPVVCRQYNADLAPEFERFSWAAPDCRSYYTDASGHAPFLYPGTFAGWQRLHEQAGLHEYHVS